MGKHARGTLPLLAWLCSLPALSTVHAAVLEVDAAGGTPFQTIQSAINSGIPLQDEVFVHCGVYPENINLETGISVYGENPACTIIDGGQSGSVARLVGINLPTVLSGFTIRNGLSELGGGIFIEGGSPTISGNVIVGNTADCGGGIYVRPTVTEALAETAPLITGNVIWGNTATLFGGGIEVFLDDGSTISNNLIGHNSATEAGGGIDLFFAFPTIVNNTIVANCLQGGPAACLQGGGGLSFDSSGISDVAHNAIVWNEAVSGGGGLDAVDSTLDLVANDAFGNLPANYAGVSDPTGTDGNISSDPAFVDQTAGFLGFQPRSDSPLIDAASGPLAPAEDLRGLARPRDGDANGTAVADIGARENEGATRLAFTGPTSLAWDGSVSGLALYNLYRGDLQTLRDTGIYTQDPGTVAGAERFCGRLTPSAIDLDEPATGQALFYLAVLTDVTEGTLGFDGSGVERPFTDPNRCP